MSYVLVVNEPFVADFCRTQRWAARTRGRVLRAPDWLAYATAVLERDGVPVRLFDFPALGWGKDRLRELLRRERPDFVVLDATTPSIYSDIECARMAKDECGAVVLMVGPHASALPEETLVEGGGAVDAIAVGEYDLTISEAVRRWDNAEEVPGLCLYGSGEPRRTPPRPLIQDLDTLPFPAWHHLDLLSYFDGTKLFPYIDIFAGRGCPNACAFCTFPQVMHGLSYRLRSPEKVVDEMEHDIALCPGVLDGGEFFFEDDTFTVAREVAHAVCDEILRRDLRLTFSVNARADTADRDLFRHMREAGCRQILVGFESGVQEVLDRMGKGITLGDSTRCVEYAHEAGLEVHGCFVLGLPGETRETMDRTLEFAQGLGLDTIQFSAAVPFPGTRYYEQVRGEGLLRARRWDDWLQEGEQGGVVDYPGLRKEEVEAAVNQGLRDFYLRPTYALNFALKTRSRADLYRKIRGFRNYASFVLRDVWPFSSLMEEEKQQ